MLFLSYLIYVVLYTFLNLTRIFSLDSGIYSIGYSSAIYVFSLIGGSAFLYLIYSYQSEGLVFFRKALQIKRIHWISFMGFLFGIFLVIIQIFSGKINWFILNLVGTYGIVSFLNWLGIEYYPRYLTNFRKDSLSIELPTIPGAIPDTSTANKFVKHYQWEYGGNLFSIELVIRKNIYKKLKAMPRVELQRWAEEYVTNGIYPEIRELAYQLFKCGQKYYEYGSHEEISFVLSFVQSAIEYQEDIIDDKPGEYPKYPIETLVEEQGDCEDVSFLGASLLKSMGYDVALLNYPGHIALGIAGTQLPLEGYVELNDKKYFYVEMTAKGWQIGEIPDNYKNETIEVYRVPSLVVT